MIFTGCRSQDLQEFDQSRTHLPEVNEILQIGERGEGTKEQRVTEKLHKKFVVAEVDTRVDPSETYLLSGREQELLNICRN